MSNPFDWSGPDFLRLYVLLLLMALAAAGIVRWLVRRTTAGPATLGPYELAYLADGPRRVALVAVSALINGGQATLRGRQLCLTGTPANGRDALLNRLLATALPVFPVRTVPRLIAGDVGLIRDTLQAQDLLVRGDGVWLSRLVTGLTMGGVLAVGVTKIGVGLSRNRPVGLLAFCCLVTVVFAVMLVRGLFRTTAGDAVLRRTRVTHPEPWRSGQQHGGDDTLVALWGLNALQSHAAFADLRGAFGPSPAASGYGTSSCSSSSCSSGSSCGSSCGGGGCGGCSS